MYELGRLLNACFNMDIYILENRHEVKGKALAVTLNTASDVT